MGTNDVVADDVMAAVALAKEIHQLTGVVLDPEMIAPHFARLASPLRMALEKAGLRPPATGEI